MTSERVGRVRRAAAGDVAGLVMLRGEMFEAMDIDASGESWRIAAHEWFTGRLRNPDYGIFVVELDGVVAASAVGAIRDAAPSPSCPNGRDILINNVSFGVIAAILLTVALVLTRRLERSGAVVTADSASAGQSRG